MRGPASVFWGRPCAKSMSVHDLSRHSEPAAASAVWQVQLLGGLRATRDDIVLARFPSRAVAMLLARLALYPRRRHSREELMELLWPGVAPGVGRNRLRQVLSTLRRLLEPPGAAPGTILVADRQSIALQAGAVACDVLEFETRLRQGRLTDALHCYRGDLLPGYFDDWVEDERLRLRSLFDTAQARMAALDDALPVAPAHPHASDSAPALPSMPASSDAPVRNLPASVSVFFGRGTEQRRLHDALSAHRLVTLSGFGGCGKTRLAVEVARAASGVDMVAFVALAECHDPRRIAERTRGALRMQASPQDDALAQLCVFLADRDVLLLLDNFEQLAECGGAEVVVDLLARLPRLRCLVTSRRVLDVAGECEIALGPLPLPDASMALAEAAATASLALFIDRARSVRPDFALTARNGAALIELARSLEGLPLAIEIAASRIRAYSPAEMCAALAQRFELLARHGPRAQRHGRHASLQATVDWSWQLLAPAQQRFLAALSVFDGDWNALAVESVCDTTDAHRQLEALVADSLLRADVDARGDTRFSMLETIREFARERLGSEAPALRARHRAHYLRVARQACAAGAAMLEPEHPNLQQAIDSALADGEPGTALAIAAAMRAYWEGHGMPPAMLQRLHAAAASCPADDANLHAGLDLLASMALGAGDTAQAHECAARALAAAADDRAHRAAALVSLARVTWERDQQGDAVEPLLNEALDLATLADLPLVQADALRVSATVVLRHGALHADYARADELFARAEALYQRAGETTWAHRALLPRAGCLIGLERYAEAQQVLDRCEQHFAAVRSSTDLMALANMIGYLESGRGRWPEALTVGRRCIRLAWDCHARLWLATAMWNLPQPLTALGQLDVAARLKAFAARLWVRHIGPLSADDIDSLETVRRRAIERLGAEWTGTLWAAGAEMSLRDAVRLALDETIAGSPASEAPQR